MSEEPSTGAEVNNTEFNSFILSMCSDLHDVCSRHDVFNRQHLSNDRNFFSSLVKILP